MTFAYRYRNYGVTLGSVIALPGLPEAPAGARVDVELEIVRQDACPVVGPDWVMVDPPRTTWRAPGARGSRLRMQYHGDGQWAEFLIAGDGGHIRMSLSDDVDLAEAVELLLTGVFTGVLAQRGATCLHASVVAVGDGAIALVGPSRAGKSTLALALVQRGARHVSDDVAVITEHDDVITVVAGRPRLRTLADSARALGRPFSTLQPVWAHETRRPPKRYHEVAAEEHAALPPEVRLTGIYILGQRQGRTPPRVRPVMAGELLPQLIANRHMAAILDRDGHRRDFARLAAIVSRLHGRELLRPDDLDALGPTADVVLADAEASQKLVV